MHSRTPKTSCDAGTFRIAAGLFLAFLTVQAAFVVLALTLRAVALDFDVGLGTAGQLRTAAAVAGVIASLMLMRSRGRFGTRALLLAGLTGMSAGSVASAVAPGLALLLVAQAFIGAAGALTLAAGLAAAVDWPVPADRSRVLAWTIVGQPAAWVVGMPLIGALSGIDWRWGWIIVPIGAAAAIVVLPCARLSSARVPTGPPSAVWRDRQVRAWAFGELMAYAGWGGTLVYVGALYVDSYGISVASAGTILGIAALAYFPGTFAARRQLEGDLRRPLALLASLLALGALAFGSVRPSPAASTGFFALLILLAGARGLIGSAFGLNAAPEQRVAIGSIRSGATQLGYVLGALAGGLAIDVGGYGALGVVLATFFTAAALPHATALQPSRPLYSGAPAAQAADSASTS